MADRHPRVQGHCPMGCGETLFLGAGGYISCARVICPRPDAVRTILADAETEHIVHIREGDFSMQHPLRERLDGELFDCALHRHLSGLSGPPREPGRYRVTKSADGWEWEASHA